MGRWRRSPRTVALPWGGASVRWAPLDFVRHPHQRVFETDCGGVVGDCLFACLSAWYNMLRGRETLTPSLVRLGAAACLREADFELVLSDVVSGENLSETPQSIEDLRALVADPEPRVWGCHSLLLLSLRFLSSLLGKPLCALVVIDDCDYALVEETVNAPTAVVLRLVGHSHYRLLAARGVVGLPLCAFKRSDGKFYE